MSIIERYVLKQFLRYAIICLGVSIFIYVVINLFDNLGKFLAKNASALDIMIYYLYLTPSYAILLIPVASMIAVFLVFGIMSKNREMLVLKTSGLSINRLFYLLLATGVVIAVSTFIFQETVGVWAQTRLIEHEQKRINRRPRREDIWRRNFFYYGENNWIYSIQKFDGRIRTMDEIVLWQISKDNKIKQRIDASYARYDSIWVFENATVRQIRDPQDARTERKTGRFHEKNQTARGNEFPPNCFLCEEKAASRTGCLKRESRAELSLFLPDYHTSTHVNNPSHFSGPSARWNRGRFGNQYRPLVSLLGVYPIKPSVWRGRHAEPGSCRLVTQYCIRNPRYCINPKDTTLANTVREESKC
jgi:lipopolysaccharide export LptBFGC system permease protein LptF